MHNDRDEFDRMMDTEFHAKPQHEYPEFQAVGPYGTPVKTGLTPRGKAALALGATVIAGGSLLGWQHYSAQQAAAQAKAQEIALKQQELRILELREINKAQASTSKTLATENAARQQQVDACVADNKSLVGKQLGATYRSVVEDCQTQYPATSSGDMQAVATTSDPTGDGGVNPGALLGAGVLGLGLAVAVRKSTKSHPA